MNVPLIQNRLTQPLKDYGANNNGQEDSKGFPLVVHSHGLAGHFYHYSGICSDLASHGYVVAAVVHRDSSATLALRRVPGPGIQKGQYDQYVDEWIPYDKPMTTSVKEVLCSNYPLRNKQVHYFPLLFE